jgi:hypothetical protein
VSFYVTHEELFATTAIKTWNTVTARLEKLLSSLSDDELQTEVSPGRNRVYYLLGHLTAYHDRLLPMLGLGERLYPELDDLFITNPDRTFKDELSASDLRQRFTKVNAAVTSAIEAMPPVDLLKRHDAVSEEDFAKEPLRNRLAVFEIRTAHAMFHAGQIRLVVKP